MRSPKAIVPREGNDAEMHDTTDTMLHWEGAPHDSESHAVVSSIARLLCVAEPGAQRLWASWHLTLLHLRLLRLVHHESYVTAGQLAQMLRVSPSSLSRVLGQLDERGLVKREHRTGDRRIVDISLTPTAMALIEQHSLWPHSRLADVARAMTPGERRQVLDATGLVHKRLNSLPPDLSLLNV